jgi:TIR domain
MAEASHAVFLSYASQDAEAARKICEALRGAGIEVFLDQSELRGGEAWDKKIRHEIHDCVLSGPRRSNGSKRRCGRVILRSRAMCRVSE